MYLVYIILASTVARPNQGQMLPIPPEKLTGKAPTRLSGTLAVPSPIGNLARQISSEDHFGGDWGDLGWHPPGRLYTDKSTSSAVEGTCREICSFTLDPE